MSCVNTFAFDLSAFLADIFSPLTGNSDFTVTILSFDFESLFTNVPIEGAVQAVLRKLESDPTLADCTKLTPAKIADLLDFVLRSTYFQYNGSIYEQREDAAMGNPVSTVIANLYMEIFEAQAIESAPSKPKIWKRYVDDTFTILDRDRDYSFLQHLNSQQPTIRFTMKTMVKYECMNFHIIMIMYKFSYILFNISSPQRVYITNSHNDQLPVDLIPQLVEHCTRIAEVTRSNPVQA